ncbi:MAG: HisA/HisF-related TIM barrel protein [Candidatus Ranarchaeia archaeon]
MEVIPAIDLMDGKVVRLEKGLEKNQKIYDHNPLKVAENLVNLGSERLHIIDLDATLGKGNNYELIKKIKNSINIPIQVGGGIRNFQKCKEMLDLDFDQVFLGSMIFNNPKDFNEVILNYDNSRFISCLDYSGDKVVINGWKKITRISPKEAIKSLIDKGLNWFLLTNTEKDGTLSGPDIDIFRILKNKYRATNFIAAGGIADISDVIKLKETGIERCIVGKALYEGKIDLKNAIKIGKK